MNQTDRLLRYILSMQGILYLATNLWGLIATRSFLQQTNPLADIFETRSFAALALVLSLFFLAGVWRKDLLRPAAFLGLGSSVAIVLVELFHLPAVGWSLLWIDMLAEIALAGSYITLFFFRREEVAAPASPEPEKTEEPEPDAAPAPLPVPAPGSFVVGGTPADIAPVTEPEQPVIAE